MLPKVTLNGANNDAVYLFSFSFVSSKNKIFHRTENAFSSLVYRLRISHRLLKSRDIVKIA